MIENSRSQNSQHNLSVLSLFCPKKAFCGLHFTVIVWKLRFTSWNMAHVVGLRLHSKC